MVIFKINGHKIPIEIPQENIYDHRWSKDEITHRWAKWPSAKITIFNSKKIDNGIFFKISGIDIGKYEIFLNHKLVLKGSFDKVGEYYDVMIEKKYLNKGKNQLLIKTNIKRTLAGPTDPRLLTFSIKDFPEQ